MRAPVSGEVGSWCEPFGAQFAMRGWYIEDGGAKIAQANRQVEELRRTFGGKLPAAVQEELDQQMAKLGVAKSMARWELGLIPLSLLVMVAMFLEQRVIPLSAAGVLALVAILAMVTVPDLKVGFSSTRFEMLAVGVPAVLGALLASLASLIQTKRGAIVALAR